MALSDASSVLVDGKLTVTFTRPLAGSGDALTIDPDASVSFLWAVGAAASVSQHSRRQAFRCVFRAGALPSSVSHAKRPSSPPHSFTTPSPPLL